MKYCIFVKRSMDGYWWKIEKDGIPIMMSDADVHSSTERSATEIAMSRLSAYISRNDSNG